MKKGEQGIIYWCMQERDWPEDWRHLIDDGDGGTCNWINSNAQCKGCKGYRKITVSVDKITTRRPKKCDS